MRPVCTVEPPLMYHGSVPMHRRTIPVVLSECPVCTTESPRTYLRSVPTCNATSPVNRSHMHMVPQKPCVSSLLRIGTYVHLHIYAPIYLSIYLSIHLSIYPSMYLWNLSIHLLSFIELSIWLRAHRAPRESCVFKDSAAVGLGGLGGGWVGGRGLTASGRRTPSRVRICEPGWRSPGLH